ncbi:unnamed protein product [Medioppia subpectinata]|uniref:Uncharacterized protein n=1 Tax=Medioppia subpectinata TaxID=1979941 RepID=A0A7R9KWN0_9ACAR|nr:unnamed protein product [Medioppia subpectinata]CAG2110096.1 unnamed protein product [Medioppia subpectinata]
MSSQLLCQLVSKWATIGHKCNVLSQSVRHKSIIRRCGYKEPPEFKKKDIRYQTSTAHRTKLMTWEDYQMRKWKADHWNKPLVSWRARMDFAENMVRLGMSSKSIEKITDLHPHCVQYLERKNSGNVELLREAEYSNFVNHHPGSY